MVISKQKIDRIKNIIKNHYNYLIFKIAGDDSLSNEDLEALITEGLITPGESSAIIEDSYFMGRSRNDTRKPAAREEVSLDEYERKLKQRATPITDAEKYAVDHIKSSAGNHITALKDKARANFEGIINSNNLEYRNNILNEEIRPVLADGVEFSSTNAQIASDMREKTGDLYRDWKRVSNTEISNGMNLGEVDAIIDRNKSKPTNEIYVFKYVNKDGATCIHCKKAYQNPDGSPKVYKLSELQANGSNYGLKPSAYRATIGPMHPNCRCNIIELPVGFKFAPDNSVTYGGSDYNHYEAQKASQKK